MRVTKHLCDMCYWHEKKEVEATRKTGYKAHEMFDLCDKHAEEVKKTRSPQELADLVYNLKDVKPEVTEFGQKK